MAENIENAGEGHNSGKLTNEQRIEAIQKLDRDLRPLEEQAESIKNQQKKLRRDFKTLTGITNKDFDISRRLSQIEDEDEQHDKCKNIVLCFNALSAGKQFDFFDKPEQAEAA